MGNLLSSEQWLWHIQDALAMPGRLRICANKPEGTMDTGGVVATV